MHSTEQAERMEQQLPCDHGYLQGDAHKAGWKVPVVAGLTPIQSQGRRERRGKDPLKFISSITSACAVDVHTPDRTGF